MKKALLIIFCVLVGLGVIACPFLYVYLNPHFSDNQISTMIILLFITLGSFLFCFIVGEITQNNSQMDKLWSILPIAYIWVIAIKGGMTPRLIVMAVLVSLWGIRLTYNFAKKGAYSIKFWSGEEDYRWKLLREKKMFKPRIKWTLFDFFFISLYQNILVLLITLPALCAMEDNSFNYIDIIASVLAVAFLVIETIADEQQWRFQKTKYKYLNSGAKLSELPHPYHLGFNTTGLWKCARHPNYLGEQGFWIAIFIFSVAAIKQFNWSAIGALLLVFLFIGSSTLAESISASKYPLYKIYASSVSRYFPIYKCKKYNQLIK